MATMTSFWASLTPDQQRAVLAYRGPENHGDPAMSLSRRPDYKSMRAKAMQCFSRTLAYLAK